MTGFVYGKMSQYAVSAVSLLAEHHGQSRRLSSAQIAQDRNLPQPVVAKILTTLSAAGLITGVPGPSGGYALARDPAEITLADVVQHFEASGESFPCPLGPGWCGTGRHCPIHDQIAALRSAAIHLLNGTNFGGFVELEPDGVAGELSETLS